MKKTLIAIVTAVFALTGISAKDTKIFLDFGLSAPIWMNLDLQTNEKSDFTYSIGADFSIRAMTSDKIGIYANAGFYSPFEEKIQKESPDKTYTYSISDWKNWWGFSVFAGAAFMPVNTKIVGLTIAPGVGILSDVLELKNGNSSEKIERTLLGIGANLGIDFYLAKNFYMKPGVDSIFYFFGDKTLSDNLKAIKYKTSMTYLTFKPSLSFGYVF